MECGCSAIRFALDWSFMVGRRVAEESEASGPF
jgi:hypothetical protein